MSRRTTEAFVDPKKVLGSRRKTINLGISASEVLYTNTEVSGDFQLQKLSALAYFVILGFAGQLKKTQCFFNDSFAVGAAKL